MQERAEFFYGISYARNEAPVAPVIDVEGEQAAAPNGAIPR